MWNELQPEEVELSTEINEEEDKLKAQVHVLLHIWKCNFAAWKMTWDIQSQRSEQLLNTKYDVSKTLFRYHKLRR